MPGLLPPSATTRPEPDTDPLVLDIDDDGDVTDRVFSTLASETSRAVLLALYDEPSTPAAVADQLDCSLQNVHYHLDRLQAAGLVRAVASRYSSRGVEMDVFAPTAEPLVLTAGEVPGGVDDPAVPTDSTDPADGDTRGTRETHVIGADD